MEFDLDSNPLDQRGRPTYAERTIHGCIYRTRPDVQGVCHSHALLPSWLRHVRIYITISPLSPLLGRRLARGVRLFILTAPFLKLFLVFGGRLVSIIRFGDAL